jgi:ribonuclease T2
MKRTGWLIAAGALAAPSLAMAQAQSCRVPGTIDRPQIEVARPDQVRRTETTRYLLSISWSPQYCATGRGASGGGSVSLQCGGSMGRFGFVLHGLWPETDGSDWPQYCAPAPRLSRATIRRNLCMTPSVQLLQHEWAKHGTCMTRNPEQYFATAARQYARIRFPDMARLAADRELTVGRFAAAFAAANRGMRPEMLAIETSRDGALEEVRVCLSRRYAWQICPPASRGENGGQRLRIAMLPGR